MAEPKDRKRWLPEPKGWKSWLPESKGWKSWMPAPKGWMPEQKGWRSWMSQKQSPTQGAVKRDWVATGRIDFATRLGADAADADQPNEVQIACRRAQNCRKHRWKRKSGNTMVACDAKGGQGSRISISQVPVGKLAHQNCSRK